VAEPTSGIIIAVVDDDPSILRSLRDLLESADHTVLGFASATTMLASGCLARIDCVVSDIDMPVMDGFALSQAVHEARPELPIVLITGHPEMLDRLPPTDARHQLVFKKPFDGQDLLTAIGDAIQNSRLHQPRS
jgi:FixJ family two-component response regulator